MRIDDVKDLFDVLMTYLSRSKYAFVMESSKFSIASWCKGPLWPSMGIEYYSLRVLRNAEEASSIWVAASWKRVEIEAEAVPENPR